MIKAIHFKNYKALRETTLPLGRLTLLIGPNGSGKSTALGAMANVRRLLLTGADNHDRARTQRSAYLGYRFFHSFSFWTSARRLWSMFVAAWPLLAVLKSVSSRWARGRNRRATLPLARWLFRL